MLTHASNRLAAATVVSVFFALASMSSPVLGAQCLPSFPFSGGWLGGDAAYSIQLNAERTLWLFGDTFVGSHHRDARAHAQMVENTIAISTCSKGKWHVHYCWNHARTGDHPFPFFDSGSRSFHYWPLDGFLYEGKLYVALLRVTKTVGGGPFGFRAIGVDLARISNPQAQPEKWSVDYLDLSRSDVAFPGVSVVQRPPYVFLFGTLDDAAHNDHAVILARLAFANLDRPSLSTEYLSRDGTWKRAPIGPDVRTVLERAAPEFSIRYHREIGKWILVEQEPGFPTRYIGMRTADRLEGPWSQFRPLFIEPEMSYRQSAGPSVFCYGAKEHPEFDIGPRTLLATYVCNSLDLSKVEADMSIYCPIVTRLQVP